MTDRRPYADGNDLRDGAGGVLGRFSSHWAACAAMIRLSIPDFRSLGGDRPEDLAEEAAMRKRDACGGAR